MRIMVLNDGSTYGDLRGCRIIDLPGEPEPEEIDAALRDLPQAFSDMTGRRTDPRIRKTFLGTEYSQ